MRLEDVTWQAGEDGEVDAFIDPNGADWDWLMAVPAHPESDRGDILAAFSSGLVIGGTSGVSFPPCLACRIPVPGFGMLSRRASNAFG
jgi:hypothetical protein